MTGMRVLGVAGAVLTATLVGGCGTLVETATGGGDVESYTCAQLAEDAADAGEVTLLKVRGLSIVEDRREDFELPTGAAETVVLGCTGTGVLSDGSNPEVRLEYTVDTDGDGFVSWAPVEPTIDQSAMEANLISQLVARPEATLTPKDIANLTADCSSIFDETEDAYYQCSVALDGESVEIPVTVDEATGTWAFFFG